MVVKLAAGRTIQVWLPRMKTPAPELDRNSMVGGVCVHFKIADRKDIITIWDLTHLSISEIFYLLADGFISLEKGHG